VYFFCDCFGYVCKDQYGLFGALICLIFNCDFYVQVCDRFLEVVVYFDGWLSKIVTMFEDVEVDILVFYVFVFLYWCKLRSINLFECFNCEVGWCIDVVGIFFDD